MHTITTVLVMQYFLKFAYHDTLAWASRYTLGITMHGHSAGRHGASVYLSASTTC